MPAIPPAGPGQPGIEEKRETVIYGESFFCETEAQLYERIVGMPSSVIGKKE